MKKIRYFCEGIFARILYGFFAVLTVSTASYTGGLIARTIGPRTGISRRAAYNIKRAFPDMADDDLKTTIRNFWDNLGRVIGEYPHLKTLAQNVTIENRSGLPADVQAVYCAAHCANWELPSHAFVHAFDTAVDVTYRPPNNPMIDTLLQKVRTSDNRINAHPKSAAGGIALIKAIRKKRSVAILSDQKYNEGINIQFFGHEAMTNPAVAVLAQKYDLPIIPIQCIRTHDHHFKIILHPPIDHKNKPTADIMRTFNGLLEQWTTETPAQWLWTHNRWVA